MQPALVEQMKARQAAIQADDAKLESSVGGPWHPNHPTMKMHLENGMPKLSDRLIGFTTKYDLHFIGDMAQKVAGALAKFCAEYKPDLTNPTFDMSSYTGYGRQALETAEEFKDAVQTVAGVPVLTIRSTQINDVLYALEQCKLVARLTQVNG